MASSDSSGVKKKALLVIVAGLVSQIKNKGGALSAAIVQRDGRIITHFYLSSYDDRCKECMPEEKDKRMSKDDSDAKEKQSAGDEQSKEGREGREHS